MIYYWFYVIFCPLDWSTFKNFYKIGNDPTSVLVRGVEMTAYLLILIKTVVWKQHAVCYAFIWPLITHRQLHTSALILKNYAYLTGILYDYIFSISQKSAIFFPRCNINFLVFLMKAHGVLSEVQTESLYVTYMTFTLRYFWHGDIFACSLRFSPVVDSPTTIHSHLYLNNIFAKVSAGDVLKP